MLFINVRDLRNQPARIWRRLSQGEDLVITSKGKPVALLSATSEDTLEESLTAVRRARAMAAVESMQSRSLAAGTDRLTLQEINAEVAAVRKARKR